MSRSIKPQEILRGGYYQKSERVTLVTTKQHRESFPASFFAQNGVGVIVLDPYKLDYFLEKHQNELGNVYFEMGKQYFSFLLRKKIYFFDTFVVTIF